MPGWPGMDRYQGRIVHPQSWPEGLDCEGKRIVVIGSGATAVTLVPALAKAAAHVTMLAAFADLHRRTPIGRRGSGVDLPIAARPARTPRHPLEERPPGDVLL